MTSLQHRRTHNLLLISKLLNQRDAASPFTLVLDNLEQSGQPLVTEFIQRANTAKVQVIFVSFATLKKPENVDFFIQAWGMEEWQKEVMRISKNDPTTKKLLILDSLNSLTTTTTPTDLPNLLSSFITPTTSLLALYHLDVPLPLPQLPTYHPSPLTLLRYLATTIFTTHSLHHILLQKSAREKSRAEPCFGLELGVEGVVQSLGSNATGKDGAMVLEMEYRRKSGRGVREWYYFLLPSSPSSSSSSPSTTTTTTSSSSVRESVGLLEDHPLYRSLEIERDEGRHDNDAAATAATAADNSTFEMGLTERQRKDREGVVLPYYDAQKGGGEGGRILYDLGSEDDFDEDEDEI